MINKEDVVAAYRMLLGREPENEEVVTHYATELSDLQALRELFMQSSEFRASMEKMQGPRAPRPPFNGPPIDVELYAAPDKLKALFDRVAAQWHHLGETEPHWSVLTNDSYYQKNFHMNRAAFYASGVAEVQMFAATLARARVDQSGLTTCVELGCGVGRVTEALAARFDRVIGLDISAAHLDVAQTHACEQGTTNIGYRHLRAIEDVAQVEPFDVLYSRIVLQHNPPPVMARLLVELLSKLRPGGIAFFQVPTYKAGYRFAIDDYLEGDNTTNMEMHYFPQAPLLALIAQLDCRVLEIREDDLIGLSVTAISNSLLIQKDR